MRRTTVVNNSVAVGFIGAVALGLMTQQARADMMPFLHFEEQTRWVSAHVELEGQTQTEREEAEDFAAFAGTAEAGLISEQDPTRQAHALARANSSLETLNFVSQIIHNMSLGTAVLDGTPGPGEDASARAESFFEVSFTLDLPHTYTLRADRIFFGDGEHTGGLFTDDGEAVWDDFWSEPVLRDSGLLPAGQYVLRHHAVLTGSGETDLQMEVDLVAIPLPAAAWMGLTMLAALPLGSRLLPRRRAAE